MFESQIAALKNFDVNAEFIKILKGLTPMMVKMNQDQLKKGNRADGSDLPEYSDIYAKKKGKSKKPKTLHDTGDFYNNFFAKLEAVAISFGSFSPKEAFLEANWNKGEKGTIMGLTDSNIDIIVRIVIERLNTKLNAIL